MTDKKDKAEIETRTIESIVKQFRGGEHRLAGQRASEFVYASGKVNEKLVDKIREAAPGIERYISAPENPVTQVPDEGGYPLTNQPENRTDAAGAWNISSDQAKREQDEIDDHLEKGRKARVKKDADNKTGGEDATKLNPVGSDKEEADKK